MIAIAIILNIEFQIPYILINSVLFNNPIKWRVSKSKKFNKI